MRRVTVDRAEGLRSVALLVHGIDHRLGELPRLARRLVERLPVDQLDETPAAQFGN